MAHKRLSSLATNTPPDEKPLPAMPDSPSTERSRLRKAAPEGSNPRSASAASGQYFTPTGTSQPSLQQLQQGYNGGAPSPLLPPPTIGAGSYSRSSSMDRSRPGTPGTPGSYSRPSTPTIILPGQSPSTPTTPASGGKEHKKKKSWFGGGRKDDGDSRGPIAWIAGHPQQPPHDAQGLVSGRPMKELWDDVDGNCYVYLFPRGTGKGASFKVDSAVFQSSPVLTKMAFGDSYSNQGAPRLPPLDARTQSLSLNDPSSPPSSPPQQRRTPGHTDTMTSSSSADSRGRLSNLSSESTSEAHLYLPIRMKTDGSFSAPLQTPPRSKDKTAPPPADPVMEDLQTLIDIRNCFAFLCGQALIATSRKHSLFHIFMTIAGILRAYEFSNLDGSTYGEIASSSFDAYVEELGLADVRLSREKTIEGIVLSERMKSVFLFNEAFTHAAGKHEELAKMSSPKYELISSVIANRLTRAAMDLDKRTASIRLILTDFDFPALFSGIMNSKMSDERKEGVRFEAWKEGFSGFRKNVLGMLKAKYGSWPPKASNKKNDLETSGLNRLVLKDLYADMSSLYDLIVDRTNLTTRTVDGVGHDNRESATVKGLRAVLSEYDRSSPPVKPPVPFDLPLLPSIKSTRPDFGSDKKKDVKAIGKKLKDDEIARILQATWNGDAKVTPFVDTFREMEKRAAHGCTIAEMVDLRIGQWIFMYVVLQALPMLACDAPGLKWTKGVEYFLCEPPRGGVPWANPNAAGMGASAGGARTWFSVGEGGGVVSLPSDVVEHGVEGIYRRSHCWVMAELWTQQNPILNNALHEQESMNANAMEMSRTSADGLPAPPPPGALLNPSQSRDSSRSRAAKRHSSLGIGLEALPLPVGVTPDGPVPSGYPPSAGGYSAGGHGGGYHSPVGSRPVTPVGERPKSAHVVDSAKTFDAILASANVGQEKKKKKWG